MRKTVVVIGGGATGVGILRDLSMRGIPAILLEQGDLAHGTSSRFHGLLHSGARYAVKDIDSARECIEENTILRRVARHCIEGGEGYFVRTAQDESAFVRTWLEACEKAGISTVPLTPEEALEREPLLAGDIKEAYVVPDASIDGFRLVWHNAESARRYGGEFRTRHQVIGIEQSNGNITGVRARNMISGEEYFIECAVCVNAAGSWSGLVAHLAGLDVQMSPDRGSLIIFNHRFISRVINRLRPSSDGDIFVPHGSVTIFGTTSVPAERPDDTATTSAEVLSLLKMGRPLFPQIDDFRILRVFAGTRPLYTPGGTAGRAASRNFHIVDHKADGLSGMYSIFGGKLTTYRLMAEKVTDLVAKHLGVTAPCRTAEEELASSPESGSLEKAGQVFPAPAIGLVADRLGDAFEQVVDASIGEAGVNELVCECEMVTLAEVEYVARDPETHTLNDIRLRTRMGMGTCQGTFCSLRAVALLSRRGVAVDGDPGEAVAAFLQERWKGLRPALWGEQLKEVELSRAIYATTLNLDAVMTGGELCAPPCPVGEGWPSRFGRTDAEENEA